MSATRVLYERGLLRELSCLIPPLGDTVSNALYESKCIHTGH